LEHVDHEVGRIVATLKRVGVLDNTLIIVTSDNGASGEGGLAGTFNETYVINGIQTPFEANMRHFDDWGGPSSYPHYHAGWAMADNTPFLLKPPSMAAAGCRLAASPAGCHSQAATTTNRLRKGHSAATSGHSFHTSAVSGSSLSSARASRQVG
jgi:arylsulfatase A-like enzyme